MTTRRKTDLVESALPDLTPEIQSDLKPNAEPIELKIINPFYDAIGIKYCHECGEPKRTNNTGQVFCPASEPSCPGLI